MPPHINKYSALPLPTADNYSIFANFPAVNSAIKLRLPAEWHNLSQDHNSPSRLLTYCFNTAEIHGPHADNWRDLGMVPIIFEVTGRIAARDCRLTKHGDTYLDGPLPSEPPMASCWLEPPEDREGRKVWHSMILELWLIAMGADISMRLGEFLSPRPSFLGGTTGRLQVIWPLTKKDGVRQTSLCSHLFH